MCWESEEKVDTTLISASQETVILILRKKNGLRAGLLQKVCPLAFMLS